MHQERTTAAALPPLPACLAWPGLAFPEIHYHHPLLLLLLLQVTHWCFCFLLLLPNLCLTNHLRYNLGTETKHDTDTASTLPFLGCRQPPNPPSPRPICRLDLLSPYSVFLSGANRGAYDGALLFARHPFHSTRADRPTSIFCLLFLLPGSRLYTLRSFSPSLSRFRHCILFLIANPPPPRV